MTCPQWNDWDCPYCEHPQGKADTAHPVMKSRQWSGRDYCDLVASSVKWLRSSIMYCGILSQITKTFNKYSICKTPYKHVKLIRVYSLSGYIALDTSIFWYCTRQIHFGFYDGNDRLTVILTTH